MARPEPFFPKSHGRPQVDGKQGVRGVISINHNDLQ